MSGNFWKSSHRENWLLDRQDLLRVRQYDLSVLTEEEYQKVFIFFANFIQVLGEQLKVRQQVIATATVYLKRFYSKYSLKCVDPLVMAPTCLYLASKVEEFGVISNKNFLEISQNVVKNKFSYAFPNGFPYKIDVILACEFFLLETLNFSLIVYQPYRPLTNLLQDACHEELLAFSWKLINDSLRTDVCLLYPPYVIALGCVQVACVILQKDMKSWFAELTVDMEKVQEITMYIMKLYELWQKYDEKKEIFSILNKMPKPRITPAR